MVCNSLSVEAPLGRLCGVSMHEVSFRLACSAALIRFGELAHQKEERGGGGGGIKLLIDEILYPVCTKFDAYMTATRSDGGNGEGRTSCAQGDLRDEPQVWGPTLRHRGLDRLLQVIR